MRDIWRSVTPLPPRSAGTKLTRPVYAALAVAVLALMMVLFVFGEELPTRIVPPVVAVIASALALLVAYAFKVEPTDACLRDVDWKTLLFLTCIFCLVQGMAKTGLLQVMSLKLYEVFGTRLTLVALAMICGHRSAFVLLANVPVAAASIVMVKGYLVTAELVPEAALVRPVHAMARRGDSRLHRHDVRRDAGRQRDARRLGGQRRGRGDLRAGRRAGQLRPVPALWLAVHGCASSRSRPCTWSCWGTFFVDRSTTADPWKPTMQLTRAKPPAAPLSDGRAICRSSPCSGIIAQGGSRTTSSPASC